MTKQKKYATAITIGCRLNQADTALIYAKLKTMGYEIVPPNTKEKLSLIVINTCSVTGSAAQKSRQSARSLRKKNPDAIIIVTGCNVDTETSFWKDEPSVDLVIPNISKTKIDEYLDKLEDKLTQQNHPILLDPIVPQTDTTTFIEEAVGYYPYKSRANIKIQDGCDSFCTYCIVPYGRGKPQSRSFDNTISEFRKLLEHNHREIILTGVNIANYNDNGRTLIDLLKELINIPGNFRIRLSSTEPKFNSYELIDIIASSPKICRFLHLPLQHGTNNILQKMGRNYTVEDFSNFVNEAVKRIPGICIGTDVIVGFPGETDELFAKCADFIRNLPLSYLHVFRYSRRKGTPAANFKDQVPHNVSIARHKILSDIGKELSSKLISRQIGKTVKVLFETIKNKKELIGWSDNYIKVKVDNQTDPDKLNLSDFFDIKITEITGYREAKGTIV